MKLSNPEKWAVAARLFYADNKDSYDCFQDALDEFVGGKNQSAPFIDAVIQPVLAPVDGHSIYLREDGYVFLLREDDGFFYSRIEMSDQEHNDMEAELENGTKNVQYEEIRDLLRGLGWRKL